VSRVVALVGATATGKSAVALEAAELCGAEIVNADALQIYRGLDIGTAKPSIDERRRVRHHLVDILEPGERCSAGEFARMARSALDEIAARGRPAIVVGGSGLYLRALWTGLAEIPTVSDEVRESVRRRLREEGLEALRVELEACDPATARRLARGDRQRIVRALEVLVGTGRPLSSWLVASTAPRPPAMRKLGLTLSRGVLYDRIAARVLQMIDRGWEAEVRRLLANGVPRDAPALQAIGYSDWIRHLDGELGREALLAAIVRATRRFAKRQETWFRREPEIEWLDAARPEEAVRELSAWLQAGAVEGA